MMDFDRYQKEALRTDRVPARQGSDDVLSLIVPMLGLAGETGQLLSEYKKHLRDGEAHRLFKERVRSEEHTSELQSLMRNSYAVTCLNKQKLKNNQNNDNNQKHKNKMK